MLVATTDAMVTSSSAMPATWDRFAPCRWRPAGEWTRLEHAAGGLGDDTYLARLKALREQRDTIVERITAGLPGHRAVEWLRAFSESFQTADVPKERQT